MEVFVARQAIFDRRLNVYAYELLFRSCSTDAFGAADGAVATSQVIANSFFSIGVEKILGGKRAFINFPRELLIDERASALPQHLAVIEILETVEPDAEVIAACRHLKAQGYLLALDDFVNHARYAPLVELADIIKVDFRVTAPSERKSLCERYGNSGIRMLAEKVETRDEFEQARAMGYCYFQGYFLSRPALFARRVAPGFKLNYLRLLREMRHCDLELSRIEGLILCDISLSYKLLRYVNSAAFTWSYRIESIRQALVLLGEQEIRKWVSLVALLELAVDKPDELVVTAILRGRFCELLAGRVGLASRKSELFLIGMFSLLDAIMDRPLEELLTEISLRDDVIDVLLGRSPASDRVSSAYSLVRAYEAGDWAELATLADRLGLPKDQIPEIYFDSVSWSDQIFQAAY
ncbi:MAG TPA: HDOD domain-containing protein [Bryobacterales bacterium]|nr:HDOD domain-containing protein [Bryobacterales bacterium]